MKNDMFELVAKAQAGDKDALEEVISFFLLVFGMQYQKLCQNIEMILSKR